MRSTSMKLGAVALLLFACSNDPLGAPDEPREHDPRFHGWWAVEQPYHALYEVTHYEFRADGRLVTGTSIPADCSGHLSRHCVTGSVANCVGNGCTSELTCVFGATWHSLDAHHLVIEGRCSDGRARDIVIELAVDASSNTELGGAGGTLVSVDGEAGWTHDSFAWAFRKCPAGASSCSLF